MSTSSNTLLNADDCIANLSLAIADEATALASADAEGLLDAVARKEAAAEMIARLDSETTELIDKGKIEKLREANLENAALMQLAQEHVLWSLGQLGRIDSETGYSSSGHKVLNTKGQFFGMA